MTLHFTRTLLTGTALVFAVATSACAKEAAVVETTATETVEAVKTATETTTDKAAETVKVAQNEAEAQAATEHSAKDGHDHSANDGPKRDLSHVTHVFDEAPDDHVYGDANAKNSIIIYASVTCPHCSDWFTNEWPAFKKDQVDSGKTKVIFREIATPPQQVAAYGFVIASCAPEEKYMDHIVYQMQQQKQIFENLQAGKGQEVYEDLGKRAGLDTEAKLKACFENPAHIDRINTSSERLEASQARGVPSFIINGSVYDSKAQSAADLGKFIDDNSK